VYMSTGPDGTLVMDAGEMPARKLVGVGSSM
jgi:hypothetical protein